MAASLRKYCTSFVLMWMCLAPVSAWSQVLPDPTRPPPGVGDAAPVPTQAGYTQVRGLQSVIVSAEHCAAIIDGETVALGAMHGSERLVEVNQRSVVLQGEYGRRALTLFPAVGMKITEALPLDQPVASCQLEQNKDTKNPAKQAGPKEKKR